MSFVYFIQQGENGPIKIGRTNDPEKRLASLQTASAVPLRLRRVIETPMASALESDLHVAFWAANLSGEWFAPVDELEALIQSELGSLRGIPIDRVRWAVQRPDDCEVVDLAAVRARRG